MTEQDGQRYHRVFYRTDGRGPFTSVIHPEACNMRRAGLDWRWSCNFDASLKKHAETLARHQWEKQAKPGWYDVSIGADEAAIRPTAAIADNGGGNG